MIRNHSNNKHFLAAVFVLFAAFLFRISWSPGENVPLKKEFATFPMEIDGWKGKQKLFDEKVLNVLGVSDYILRDYIPQTPQIQGNPVLPVTLYVGYYESQRKGKTYHSPKNCLPGGGWQLIEKELISVDFSGKTHVINKVLIQKDLDKQLVLYWYQDRGRIIASEYWAKIYLVTDAIKKRRTDGAFVRITAPIVSSAEDTFKAELSFAKSTFSHLNKHLPN
jgi:EpsI family protein